MAYAASTLSATRGASGSRPLPGGEKQSPGGSTRAVPRVRDLRSLIDALRSAGVAFRNTMETGPAGRQIQVLDPDGNPIELCESAQAPCRASWLAAEPDRRESVADAEPEAGGASSSFKDERPKKLR